MSDFEYTYKDLAKPKTLFTVARQTDGRWTIECGHCAGGQTLPENDEESVKIINGFEEIHRQLHD